ncbi:pilus assembly protein PilO [Thioalkalivibrio versutus]|uniref:Pilus assembly protein PilO n=1 Tax=Thioalkalivibrio versutus TaxID=106634 RepID=A0A0G3FZ07_9GAMM|nr:MULTISPECIES: type 4a pilus biogenesis protein PilO [Thioalkalivibrio]AKJ94185.1 pilus assembly protein PilO [Thioalkalivibrio versutus]OOC49519.1 pilus assembly protein PilO [Thioalkalivibrio versutus]
MDLNELKQVDFNNIGEASWGVKGLILVVIVLAILGLSYYLFIGDQRTELERAESRELQLRDEFEDKQQRAANLQAYEDQLEEMERMFASLLELLPSSAEIPSLLVDVSQTGLQAGLEIELFEPRGENRRDFYAEVPIRLRVRGDYEDLAEFVSGVSALPRVVTMHNMHIRPGASDNDLLMDAVARTYRYLEEN